MRQSVLAIGAALVAAAAWAQQAPLPPGQDVPLQQPQFEEQQEPETVPQPRFISAPGSGGFEVTPLDPPGSPDDQAAADPDGSGVRVLENAPDDRSQAAQRRFKSVPEDASTPMRPSGLAVPIDQAPTDIRHGVRLRELDKMTGQTETFEIAVGEERQVDRLKIRLEACRSPESNDTHGTMAFLKVWDVREPDEEAFSGWMFAESPSLSALDHPRYDLWVISCTTSTVAVSSPSE